MSEMQGIEKLPEQPTKYRIVILGRILRRKISIKALQVAEQVVRHKDARMTLMQCAGAGSAFYGAFLYSHRVAFILLGVGVILAAERQ